VRCWRTWRFWLGAVEASAPLDVVLSRDAKALASLSLLFISIFEFAPRKQTKQRLDAS